MTTFPPVTATDADIGRGWVEFACPKHDVLVVAPARCTVTCACGRRAKPTLNGTTLTQRDLARFLKTVEKSRQQKPEKDEPDKNAAKVPANRLAPLAGAPDKPSQAQNDPSPVRGPQDTQRRQRARKSRSTRARTSS